MSKYLTQSGTDSRIQSVQTNLLHTIAELQSQQLDLDDIANDGHLDEELAPLVASAAERLRMAVADLRAAESYLNTVNTVRQRQRKAARDSATAERNSMMEVIPDRIGQQGEPHVR